MKPLPAAAEASNGIFIAQFCAVVSCCFARARTSGKWRILDCGQTRSANGDNFGPRIAYLNGRSPTRRIHVAGYKILLWLSALFSFRLVGTPAQAFLFNTGDTIIFNFDFTGCCPTSLWSIGFSSRALIAETEQRLRPDG